MNKKKSNKSNTHTTRHSSSGGGLAGVFNTINNAIIRDKPEMDFSFLFVVIILVAFGLTMLLSASTPTANVKFGRSYHFFMNQLFYIGLGTAAMLIIANLDYHIWKKALKWALPICLFLLLLVLIPGVGIEHNGSRRWLKLPGFEIQPSEFMKPIIAMYFAMHIERGVYNLKTLKGIVPYAVVIAITAILMLLETHLSGTIVICGIAVVVLFAGGMSFKWLLVPVLGAPPALLFIKHFMENRWMRVVSFLDPFADIQGSGYQVVQALYAIGSGGIFGRGLGQSVQKYSYLPEPYNDFIFAIVCEELGLIGAMIIIFTFTALIIRGVKIAMEAPDVFGMLSVIGIMAHVAIQTVLNIAVATSSIPNTGIALPFFSYGGTGIMVLLAEMGVVLSVSRYSKHGMK